MQRRIGARGTEWTEVGRPGESVAVAEPAVLEDLDERELVQDSTDREALAARLGEGPLTVYCGFDPTADSLHMGHLVPLLLLRRLQVAGHRPIALVGGATGLVGDPSGANDERPLLDAAEVDANVAAISRQLERLLDFEAGPTQATLVDNRSWTASIGVLEFLRDVGKHVTVNTMLGKESVRARVEGTQGISFTEFAYMLLQANDYRWLHEHHGCELQVGGSDQWGNITAGIDLIRRRAGAQVHGLTVPLVTRSDGTKFGKSAAGETLWLSPERTSPYRFYQYWMQVDDRDLGRFLRQLTFASEAETLEVVARHDQEPDRRHGQRVLARMVTELVHGPDAAAAAEAASGILFGSPLEEVGEDALSAIAAEVPTSSVRRAALDEGIPLVDLLVDAELVASRSEGRRALGEGSVYVNNQQVTDDAPVGVDRLLHGRYLLLRRGKRRYHLLECRR